MRYDHKAVLAIQYIYSRNLGHTYSLNGVPIFNQAKLDFLAAIGRPTSIDFVNLRLHPVNFRE